MTRSLNRSKIGSSLHRWLGCLMWLENALLVVSFMALVVLSVMEGMFYQAVFDDTTVLHPPYHPDIRLGTELPLFTACVALAWLVATRVCHCNCWQRIRPWRLILALVHKATAALLIASAVMRSNFLPRPLESCVNADVWPARSDVPPDTPTAFQVIRPLRIVTAGNSVTTRPVAFCNMVIMLLCAISDFYIFTSLGRLSESPKPTKLKQDGPLRRAYGPRIRFALATRQRRQEFPNPDAAPGTAVPWMRRRQGYMSPGSESPVEYEMGDLEDASQQTRLCDHSVKDHRCWGCSMQSCHDCRIFTTRQRPSLPPRQVPAGVRRLLL
ncbi:hypothetical protein FE257_000852 [Aspergillus nanangensis]|uniref:Uncharacterized protein n=1 Tax=Aspergillus nanangensis TaxID=2582783 RepID=A0AAD4CFN4_ASPNN|nr:hypothetical protein FE257_000852 [Aspergillus nanangensis]